MGPLNATQIVVALGRTSAQAGVLVLVVLLVQRLFRKQLPPRWSCALWFLVFARLLLPISFSSTTSIFNWLPQFSRRAAVAPAPAKPATRQSEGPPPPVIDPATPVVSPSGVLAQPDAAPSRVEASKPLAAATPTAVRQVSAPAASRAEAKPVSWSLALLCVWLAGIVVLGAHVAIVSIRSAWRFEALPPLHDPSVLAVLEESQRQLGVHSHLIVVESTDVASPALHGLWRPRLLLPKGFTAAFSPHELRFVFLHELAHLKRWDLPLNWLSAFLQILHWFNPLVWLGFARWRADRELACDALALEAAGEGENREYGRTILRLLEKFVTRSAAPGLVGILEDKGQLHRRIRLIAGFRPGKRWGLFSAALLALLGLICLTDAQAPKRTGEKTAIKGPADTISLTKTNDTRELRRGADPLPTANGTNIPAHALRITVVDAETGKPVPEAELFAPNVDRWDKPKPRRFADGQGQYLLQAPFPPDKVRRDMSLFTISAKHPDYARRAVGWTASGGDVYAALPKEATIKLEKGIAIGGVVRDERGTPLPGVRVLLSASGYRGFTIGTGERKSHEYSEVWETDEQNPASISDSAGHWSFAHFPSDLASLEITILRSDGSRETFSTPEENRLNSYPIVSIAALREQNAVFALKDGVTVRGVVVDEAGRPLPGVKIKEGYGHGNIVRVSEFLTGADGRFERLNRAPRQWIYTGSAEGRTTVTVVAQVEPGMPEVRLVLPPAKPLRLRVTDNEGKALAGASTRIDNYRTEAQILDWEGETDAEGRAIWSNAPTVPVTFFVYSEMLVASRKVKALAGEAEKLIVLSQTAGEKITARINAVDSATRQPVKVLKVAARYGGLSPFKSLTTPMTSQFSVEIRRSDFGVSMYYPSYELMLEADGCDSLLTDFIDFDEGDRDLELALVKGGDAGGVVLLPDGGPAAGARVWARASDNDGPLFCNGPGRYYGDRMKKAQAAVDGRFQLPGVPGDPPVVFTHANGFLETTLAEIKRNPAVRLQPWGRVEGRLTPSGQLNEGVSISLSTLQWTPAIGFHLSYSTRPAPDGAFVFTNVPSGDYKIYRWLSHRRQGTITESHQMPLMVKPGETVRIEYGGGGRAVIGQAMPDKPEMPVDWLNDDQVLVLKQPPIPAVKGEDYASFKAFQEANNDSYKSPARLRQAREARTYQLMFERDGSFRVDGVPAGSYELRIRLTKPGERQQFNQFPRPEDELGSLVREVVVPPGEEPLDLGTLVVALKGDAGGSKAGPVDLAAQTLEGQRLSLAQFRGRHVLLAFWAPWSERCAEQLADLQKLQAQFGEDARFAFLSLSVDGDMSAVRKTVEARGYHGTHGWLDSDNRAKVTAAFDVSTLPAVFLIDQEGRVVGRDLEGERLRQAIQRALQRK